MLVNGVWTKDWDPVQKQDSQGRFVRESSAFRNTFSAEQIAEMKKNPQPGKNRFKLYVGYICPWATRTLIARSLLGLEDYIDVMVAEPVITDYGWNFAAANEKTQASNSNQEAGISFMHELYTQSDADYTGRATVPVLWDSQENQIINNESSEIIRIFNQDLRSIHQSDLDLTPAALLTEIDQFNESIYHSFNNGVYRAGFAQSQQAYNEAIEDIFNCLDQLEQKFADQDFAVGYQLTESDIRLFVTLVRFDVAYHGIFKTNLKRIMDYPNLSSYLERLLTIKAFGDNTYIEHIKRGYHSVKKINPSGVVPAGPILPWFDKVQLSA